MTDRLGEAVDVEVMSVLLRCWRWGKGANYSESYTSSWSWEQQPEKPDGKTKVGTKREEFGRRDWNVSEGPQTLLPLPPFLSSLHLFLSFQQTGRQPELSHSNPTPHCCHGERGEEKQSDCSWI